MEFDIDDIWLEFGGLVGYLPTLPYPDERTCGGGRRRHRRGTGNGAKDKAASKILNSLRLD